MTKRSVSKFALVALSLGVMLVTGTEVMAAKLSCYSGRDAQVYPNNRGTWSLKSEVLSEWTLKDAVLKNNGNKDLGGEKARVTYDKRTTDVREFKLKADVFCNYRLALPRDWKSSGKFQAQLESTCDDMFDASSTLYCNIK